MMKLFLGLFGLAFAFVISFYNEPFKKKVELPEKSSMIKHERPRHRRW